MMKRTILISLLVASQLVFSCALGTATPKRESMQALTDEFAREYSEQNSLSDVEQSALHTYLENSPLIEQYYLLTPFDTTINDITGGGDFGGFSSLFYADNAKRLTPVKMNIDCSLDDFLDIQAMERDNIELKQKPTLISSVQPVENHITFTMLTMNFSESKEYIKQYELYLYWKGDGAFPKTEPLSRLVSKSK